MQGRARRSSIKCAMVSVIDESVAERPSTRRVSFAPTISVCGVGSFPDDFEEQARCMDANTVLQDMSVGDSSDMSLSDSISAKPGSSTNVLPMMDETWELSPSTFICDTPKYVSPHEDPDVISHSSSSMTIQECIDFSIYPSHTTSEHHKPPTVGSPVQSKSEDSFTEVTSVTPTNYPKLVPSSEGKPLKFTSFSDRHITSSLPPLRHHQGMPTTVHFTSKSSLIEVPDRKLLSSLRGTRATFDAANQLLSQSSINTPLRQVAPKYPVQGDQKSIRMSIFSDGNRRDPTSFLPSVDRLQSHVSRLSVCAPCELRFLEFGVAPSSLTEFLNQHPCIPSMLPKNPSFPSNLNDLERFQPHLYKEFLDFRKRVELSCTKNVAQFTYMAHFRRSSVLLDHSQSLPVVEQLSKMNGAELTSFLAEAHEQLYTAELFARHGLLELKNASLAEYQLEQKYEHDRIEQLIRRLDRDELLLQRTAEQLDSEIKAYQLIESTWTDCMKRSEALATETNVLKSALNDVLTENAHLTSCLTDQSKPHSHLLAAALPPVDRAVGASTLFSSPNVTAIRNRTDPVNEDADASRLRIANLLSPCVVDCLSFDEQKYSLRTFFGLVSFHIVCNSLHSVIHGKQKLPFISLENLTVAEVECCATPSHLLPAECEPVKVFANQTIAFFNTHDVHSKLRTLLIGITLDKVIKVVEFLISPYLVLAADLRAMYWAGHEVHFAATDLSSLCSSQKALHSSLPVESSRCLDNLPSNRLTLPGPVSITVTIFSQAVFSVLRLLFVFPSIEMDAAEDSITSANVLCGPIDSEQARTFLESRRTLPGGMYRTVCEMIKLLPSWKV